MRITNPNVIFSVNFRHFSAEIFVVGNNLRSAQFSATDFF